ncbi:MAG: dTMP kinase [Thaumarchaeota archaeon]|nr:dTMP kinase [Nitrososphaerota archaeon]
MSGQKKTDMLLSFEGIDASGKNTQSKMLFEYFKGRGEVCEYLSFPDYTTPVGKEIKNYLGGNREYSPESRHLLYAANHYEQKERILQLARKGTKVILNRYCESNLAYGVSNGLPLTWLREIESLMPQSDVVFYLKISPEVSMQRKRERDRFESDAGFLKRVMEMYDALAEPGRWFTIDANQRIDLIHYQIVRILENLFQNEKAQMGSKASSELRAIF